MPANVNISKARQIMGILNNNVIPKVKKNSKAVQELVDEIIKMQPQHGPNVKVFKSSILHCGSAYEGLAVDEKADFDLSFLLGEPLESDNFEVRTDPSGYLLEWKSHIQEKEFSDCNGYVEATKLRKFLFEGYKIWLEKSQIQGAVIKYQEGLAALKVTIEYNASHIVEIDFVPKIVFRTWDFRWPNLKPLADLPKTLRQYIYTLSSNKSPIMCFTLAVSGAKDQMNREKLFSPSFAILEKKFLEANVDIRDMVRLVKLVAKQKDWKKKFNFCSYFVKRVAIKYCDELKGKNEWDGYNCLLRCFEKEIRTGQVDGFFIEKQVCYRWEPRVAEMFRQDILSAININLSDVEDVLLRDLGLPGKYIRQSPPFIIYNDDED